jgi:stearoyl-CoA desaturase (delta-9 desaturase)
VTESTSGGAAAPRRINWLNLTFLLSTFLIALAGAPWSIARFGLAWPEVATFLFLWVTVGLSVTAGYHRLFAHRAYKGPWPVRLFLLVFGAGALENSVLLWAADHRVHHAHVDEERDPYNIQKGFWWAHIGWIFYDSPADAAPLSVVRDLQEDPLVVWQARWYAWIGFGVALGLPLAAGLATGRVLPCLLVGGVLRIVASHHGTFFINSLCHMVGRQPYSREHSARDSALMAVLAFGEGYHNYHHSFPFDYRNGVKPWHFDPAKWFIWGLARLGLAAELRRAPDAAILKAKVEVQFERAKERMQQVVHDFKEHYEAKLHEAYAKLDRALGNLQQLQRRARVRIEAVADDWKAQEARLRASVHDLEEAMAHWRQTLRTARSLPVGAAA